MNYSRPELLDRLAAEYVLGTLRGRARRRFEQLLTTLPAARVAVEDWNSRLARLAEPVPAVAPPARVWSAIDARTSPRAVAGSPAAAKETSRQSLWATFWKPAFGFAFGAALTVGLVQIHPSGLVSLDDLANDEQALPQSYVGLLTDTDNRPTLLVSSTRQGTRVTVKFLRPVATPAGKVIQVWALPREGAPFPLGVATAAPPPKSTTFEMSGSSEKLLAAVPRLAVSFEDAPAGAQTRPGEFVLAGFCVKLW
jgi:anti-sigma-K factor RskA